MPLAQVFVEDSYSWDVITRSASDRVWGVTTVDGLQHNRGLGCGNCHRSSGHVRDERRQIKVVNTVSLSRQCTQACAIPLTSGPVYSLALSPRFHNQAHTHSLRTRATSHHVLIHVPRPRFPTHRQCGLLLGSVCGNSVRSQMEDNLASMISSHPDSIQFPPLPASLTPMLKPACPACRRSSYRRVPPILSETSATPLPPSLSSALNSNHKRRCSSYFCLSQPRGLQTRHLGRRRFTQPIRERGNSPTQDISVESRSSRPQSTGFFWPSGCPAFLSPRPVTGVTLEGLSPAIVGDS